MKDLVAESNQIKQVTSFQELVTLPFMDHINAMCWQRALVGDFSEIVSKLKQVENIEVISEADLVKLDLTAAGEQARELLLQDLAFLKAHGAAPSLNLIKYYERDDANSFFPTDVYSFHVDRSPIPTSTFLCTYFGAASEILPNAEAVQKIKIPEIRSLLQELHGGVEEDFNAFLTDNYFDLHYLPQSEASAINLGVGNMWRLAVDHPESAVLPCIHRAPMEKEGQSRLLLIC